MAFIPEIMDFLFGKEQTVEEDLRLEGLKPIVQVSKNWQFNSFLNLFEALLLDGETKESLIEKEEEIREREEQMAKRASLTSLNSLKAMNPAAAKAEEDNLSDQSPREDDPDLEASAQRKKKSTKAAPYYDVMEPKKLNWVIQQFIMALVWGFGGPLTVPARSKYSVFINDSIKKIFSSTNCSFVFKKRID